MKYVARTLYGLEEVLASELTDLGAEKVKPGNRAVFFEGNRALLYRVNYCTRTALSFLRPLSEFRIRSKNDLYRGGSAIEWDRYMDVNDTFSVDTVVSSPYFNHTGYPGLILKDAIVDQFRKKRGKRPSVNVSNPDVKVNLHIRADYVTISVDSTVVPLFKRGYRHKRSMAPVNEVLAAGILLLSGWNASGTLMDPMCGSGTIPVEAAMIACNIPPAIFRSSFGFQRWKDYDEGLFDKIRQECNDKRVEAGIDILGSDISPRAIEYAKENVERAGLADVIKLKVADFKHLTAPHDKGFLFLNPPYGKRLQPVETDHLYSMIGTVLKHNFPGFTAWLITYGEELIKHIGLKPQKRYDLYNGALKCKLLKYEMYKGSKRRVKGE